tara:strand:- start:170 stop:562 length:393 start_codon:yes stop_codon:yes gene_type:complete
MATKPTGLPEGRPTKYTPELLAKANKYIEENTRAIPSRIGLAYFLGIANSTLDSWADKHAEFSGIVDEVTQLQYMELTDNGLSGGFNSSITKLMLTKHGLSDKMDSTSSDGSMSPTTVTRIELVAKEFDV